MLGFFNQENRWRATMQVANGLVLVLAAYEMINNPETAWENGFEIAMHALNMITFQGNDNALTSIGNAALNFSSLGAIYGWVASGGSSRPVMVNVADALLHLTNAVTSICYRTDTTPKHENTTATHSM
ncbi:hypothetical protein Lgra_2204 [Legionella gratiana]|uniref:Uncharacterized protein n=1 Tax=Legionella gratiana TaxID=45066 RepID=A0A378JEF7_9GAMM|nr:hypothetical protein [Legionella gratiana]KTD08969.1 hypothetical protein Lgra_2204 [Legionella gratiana]STX45819.1 Uncharacterised protein [Legionella gratiana]